MYPFLHLSIHVRFLLH